MISGRHIATICGLVVGCLAFDAPVGAQPAPSVMTCTNPASGTTWQIRIDYGRRTVDGYAANIDESEITWYDTKDKGTYTLDRKTGRLNFVAPSSMGGYFLFDQCRPTVP